jgi:vacuolar-type H+-ATPase subunit I/STV1
MAKETVNLSKTVYNKNQYTKVIDTQFSQLVFTPSIRSIAASTPSTETQINKFFNQYQNLFFDIPKLGEINSHEYLIRTSKEYIGNEIIDPLIETLTEEVNQLREENNELQQQVLELSNQQSNNISSVISSLSTNGGNS